MMRWSPPTSASNDQLLGKEKVRSVPGLSSLARTKLILATADRETATWCSDFIGHRQVRDMEEGYSYGYNNARDAVSLTPRRQVEPLLMPDQFMNLPRLSAYLKFPDGFPAAPVTLIPRPRERIAEGFIPRDAPATCWHGQARPNWKRAGINSWLMPNGLPSRWQAGRCRTSLSWRSRRSDLKLSVFRPRSPETVHAAQSVSTVIDRRGVEQNELHLEEAD